MAKKPYETGKTKLAKKMAEEQGTPVTEVVAAVPVVTSGLPQAIEGVKTQVFADACKVILADEIKAAEVAMLEADKNLAAVVKDFKDKVKPLVTAWGKALGKDLEAVLQKHSAMTPRGCGRNRETIFSLELLKDMCPFNPEDIRISEMIPSVIPEPLRVLHQKVLDARQVYAGAESYRDSLRARAKDLDTEVARYRLSEGEGMTPDQYEKVKAMLLRKD